MSKLVSSVVRPTHIRDTILGYVIYKRFFDLKMLCAGLLGSVRSRDTTKSDV